MLRQLIFQKKTALIIIAIGVVGGLLIYFYLPGFTKYQTLKAREQSLVDKIDMLEESVAKLEKEKHLLENDVLYLERVARENLGRVEEGETVYKVVNETVYETEG